MTTIKLDTKKLLGYVDRPGANAAKSEVSKLTGAKVGGKDSPIKLAGAKVGSKSGAPAKLTGAKVGVKNQLR